MRMHGSVWTDDDLKRLAAIVTAGGTPLRASAALRRSIAACRNQAKKIGTPKIGPENGLTNVTLGACSKN